MNTFIDSAKGILVGVGDAASAAAREIDKRRRIINVEGEIDQSRRMIQSCYDDIAKQIVALFQANPGQVPSTVQVLCEQVIGLDAQIKVKEQEVESIRKESAANAVAEAQPAVPPQVALPVANAPQPAPTPASVAPGTTTAMPPPAPVVAATPNTHCPQCGAELTKPGARFCVKCGTKLV